MAIWCARKCRRQSPVLLRRSVAHVLDSTSTCRWKNPTAVAFRRSACLQKYEYSLARFNPASHFHMHHFVSVSFAALRESAAITTHVGPSTTPGGRRKARGSRDCLPAAQDAFRVVDAAKQVSRVWCPKGILLPSVMQCITESFESLTATLMSDSI